MLIAAPHRHVALIAWSLPRTIPIAAIAVLAVGIDHFVDLDVSLLAMPTTALGTSIALFLGFKNNQAYDRFWEGRKIWGSVVNTSRAFAASIVDFVRTPVGGSADAVALQREMVLRHLAWTNALRMHLRRQHDWDELQPFLSPDELADVRTFANVPHRLLRIQSERVEWLASQGLVEGMVRHLELRVMLRDMWDQQGGCERIKNTPLVPHYTTAATIFTWIFIGLFPFTILDVLQGTGVWIVVPIATLVGWVYDTTNRLGQLTADPFDRLPTDVSMSAICRSIEIDLRPMIGDQAPPPLTARGLVLD